MLFEHQPKLHLKAEGASIVIELILSRTPQEFAQLSEMWVWEVQAAGGLMSGPPL